jgi:predicted ATP-dependent serine protease
VGGAAGGAAVTDPFEDLAGARRHRGRRDVRPLEYVWFRDAVVNFTTNSVVKGLMEKGQLSLVFGPSGCGKTFLMLDLAIHVAWGREWCGSKVTRGGVVYVAAEAGRSIVNRLHAFKTHHKVNDDLPFVAVTSPVDLCHDLKPADIDRLVALIREVSARMDVELVLVVIDTVNRAMSGGNENEPGDMGAFIGSLDKLREQLGCHVAAVHHNGKDHSRGARGHSSLECAVDTVVEVKKHGATSTATVTKQRDGKTGRVRAFRLKPVEIGRDEDDEPVSSCILEWTEAPTDSGKVELTAAQSRLIEALRAAIRDRGVNDMINGRVAVSIEEWQKEFYCREKERGANDSTMRSSWGRRGDVPGVAVAGGVAWIEDDDHPF